MREGNLEFPFPEDTQRLDRQDVELPQGMMLVDFWVKEKEKRRSLLVEVKDPSENERAAARPFPQVKEYVNKKLTPKARDSYTYIHLRTREEDTLPPTDFAVVIGAELLPEPQPLLTAIRDELRKRVQKEGFEPWERQYIREIGVYSIETWNKQFPEYPCTRIA